MTTPYTGNSALTTLLAPKTIAIIGASENANKLSGRILVFLKKHGFEGSIWPVNPSHDSIADLPCFRSIAELPDAPDLAIVALSPKACVSAVEDLASHGTRACAVLSSGFAETGEQGNEMEKRIAEIARENKMLLLGPNCLGFVNAFDNTAATFSQYAGSELSQSPVAFVSQSGAFGTAVAGLARSKGLGLGWFVNTGNEAALDVWDILSAALEDDRIQVLAGYVENLGNGRKMAELARRAAVAGKPLIISKVGNSLRGAQAATAHTGALATPGNLFSGVAARSGVVSVTDERDMLNVIETVLHAKPIKGSRFGIVTMSGGAGVLMADLAEQLGSPIGDLTEQTREQLRECVPEFGSLNNPVDVTAQFIAKPEILVNSIEALQSDPNIDCVIVWLQMMDGFGERIAKSLARCRDNSDTPLLVSWVASSAETRAALQAEKIATFDNGGDAVRAAVALAKREEIIDSVSHSATILLQSTPPVKATVMSASDASLFLQNCGVKLADSALADSAEAAAKLIEGGGKFAFKIASADIAHKSDSGGVVLNVEGKKSAHDVYLQVMERVTAAFPKARIDGVEVQPMVSDGLEIVFGARNDASFGPVVMLGFGGIYIEILGGAQFAVAPVSLAQAKAMISALPAQELLDGTRGTTPVDRETLAETFTAFSEFIATGSDRIAEIDLNPVVVNGSDIVAVDWLVSAEPS